MLECKRCGHQWLPRVPRPQECPACKSRRWDKD
jgi:predicted Zn-ribbon and HTH transcriptional regulator